MTQKSTEEMVKIEKEGKREERKDYIRLTEKIAK